MGIIVMVGIVVSKSTLPADFADEGRRQGAALRRAVESGRIQGAPDLDRRARGRGRADRARAGWEKVPRPRRRCEPPAED
jgi:hypothetical protein